MRVQRLVMAHLKLGGRILSVNVFIETKEESIDLAYENIKKIKAYKDAELKDEDTSLIFYRLILALEEKGIYYNKKKSVLKFTILLGKCFL